MKAIHAFLYKDRYFKFEGDTFQVEIEFDLYCILAIAAIIIALIWMF
jgi:hypothetical protein